MTKVQDRVIAVVRNDRESFPVNDGLKFDRSNTALGNGAHGAAEGEDSNDD